MIWFFLNSLLVFAPKYWTLMKMKSSIQRNRKAKKSNGFTRLKLVYIWKYIENIILSFDIVVFQFLCLGSCFMAIYKKTIYGEYSF